VIVGHHGGETSLLQVALASGGSVPVLVLMLRAEVARLGRRMRRIGRRGREL
jgi:hypothetical protein